MCRRNMFLVCHFRRSFCDGMQVEVRRASNFRPLQVVVMLFSTDSDAMQWLHKPACNFSLGTNIRRLTRFVGWLTWPVVIYRTYRITFLGHIWNIFPREWKGCSSYQTASFRWWLAADLGKSTMIDCQQCRGFENIDLPFCYYNSLFCSVFYILRFYVKTCNYFTLPVKSVVEKESLLKHLLVHLLKTEINKSCPGNLF